VWSHIEVLMPKEDDSERTEREESECNLQNIPLRFTSGHTRPQNNTVAYLHFSDNFVFVNLGKAFD
jgi:hypothetical protein